MSDYAISAANLSYIERSLNSLVGELSSIDDRVSEIGGQVNQVESNVRAIYGDLAKLASEFRVFEQRQTRANEKANSQQRLIQLNQELEKKFGHYDVVRRTTTGILQADDLGLVRKSTISTATEEMMITTPGYWLAPCLVALAAWINNQPELAEKAIKEGIVRNDEKTSLFFALVCRRADRMTTALKWTRRYLANQDEENLDRKTVIILDAYASGLLGADSDGVIAQQMGEWLDHLTEKPGFIEKQTQQWSDAINAKKEPYVTEGYGYLKELSPTWSRLSEVMEVAELHATILDYFTAIFDKKVSNEALKTQLDEILNGLVTDFDDEEIPLRKEAKYNELVVKFEGDVDRARQNMELENSAFETHKDFTQLLTDAAMNPEEAHASVSTQKFAIALSKDWISTSYNDIINQNHEKVPEKIDFNVGQYSYSTTDGKNENEIVQQFSQTLSKERDNALSKCVLNGFDQFCLYGGGAIALIGVIMLIFSNAFFGLIATIAGVGMVIKHFSRKKQIAQQIQNIHNLFNQNHENGCNIIKTVLAEVVAFREEFAKKDAESRKVIGFLEQISPEKYVRKLADTGMKNN